MKHHPLIPFHSSRQSRLGGLPAALWAPSNAFAIEYGYVALGFALIFLLLLFLRRRGKKYSAPSSPLENPTFITAVLDAAAEQRVRADIACANPDRNYPPTSGYFVKQNNNDAIYIVTHDAAVASTWKNVSVNVFFNFTSRGERTFYHFTALVINVRPQEGRAILALERPKMLTNNQRREFARISPEADMVAAVALWPCGPNEPLPEGMSALGRPNYAYRPPKLAQIVLMDISAGGALVRLSAAQVAALDKTYAVGEKFYFMTALKNLKDDGMMTMFYAVVCRRTILRKETGHIELGLQFLYWCSPGALTAGLEWQPVEEDGEVPPLLRWTSRAAARMKRMAE